MRYDINNPDQCKLRAIRDEGILPRAITHIIRAEA
jgi:hypothetical protein